MRRGFTLLELLVVAIIIGLAASITAITFRSHVLAARMQRAQFRVSEADRIARQLAQSNPDGITQLSILKDKLVIEPGGREIECPKGVQLERVSVAAGLRKQSSPVEYSSNGQSGSYVLELRSLDRTRWLAVLGLTGQVVVSDSLEQIGQLEL